MNKYGAKKTVVNGESFDGYKRGPAYNLFMLKKKLMYDKYGILVKEV